MNPSPIMRTERSVPLAAECATPRGTVAARLLTIVAIVAFGCVVAGCDAWKSGDAEAGLILAPGVSRVTEDGREFVRIRGRQSVMFVDSRGGRVVDFHRAAPPRVFFIDDPDRAGPGEGRDRTTPVQTDTAVWPNVFGKGGWRVELTPDVPGLRDTLMWQSDASIGRLALVSDAIDGLRLKCEYQLEREGDAVVSVTLINTTGEDRRVDVRSVASVSEAAPVMPTTQPRGEATRRLHRTLEKPSASGAGGAFPSDTIAWPAVIVPARGTFTWSERWHIPREPVPTTAPMR